MTVRAPASGTILIADDNRVNRLLLARGLEQEGHTVAFAEDGREALEQLRQRRFDLLLLDVLMPELDGYEVLAELQGDPHLRDIPVVVTSALDEIDSVVRCLEMGAEDYLTKPVNPVLLNARINASLEKKRLRDQQRELISKFATKEVADDLLTSGFSLGGQYVDASAMFCDIRSFTTIFPAWTTMCCAGENRRCTWNTTKLPRSSWAIRCSRSLSSCSLNIRWPIRRKRSSTWCAPLRSRRDRGEWPEGSRSTSSPPENR